MSCPNETFKLVEDIPLPFQTYTLYMIFQQIYNICANDPRLITGALGPLLTKNAAIYITGNSGGIAIFRDWSPYETSLILKRFIAWKIPLFQLLMQFSLAPYKFKMKFFAIFHVMGDPIDTIASLMFTLSVSKKRLDSLANMEIKNRSALVLIITSYEECGRIEADELKHEYESVNNDSSLESTFITTAHALAADRATKLLPVLSAVGLLFGTIAVSFFKIESSPWNSTDPWHIDLHSLAFSLTLTWVVPTVLLSAVVGVPHSQFSSNRILCQFEALTLTLRGLRTNVSEILSEALEEPEWTLQLENGGIPSWRCDRWSWIRQSQSRERRDATEHTWARDLVALLVVAIGSIGAALLSNFVPPDGFNCRAMCEVVILSLYISSYAIGVLLARCHIETKMLFWISMVKDVLFTLSVAAVILLTQVGILNRIDCYLCEKGTALCLPDQTKDIVSLRMHNIYPEIFFCIFTSQLFIWVILALFYIDSLAVFLQQDDGRDSLITRMVGFKLALLRILRLRLPGARPRVMAEYELPRRRGARKGKEEHLIDSI